MPISALHIENFKGIADPERIPIRPITLFIGPNSSGKSSCIHGLAALAQTVKLSAPTRALVLDDQYAQVHLGRFIEVIHSRTYKDAIRLGVEIPGVRIMTLRAKNAAAAPPVTVAADYAFKSTRRTQELYLENALMTAGTRSIEVKRTKEGHYRTIDSAHAQEFKARRANGFLCTISFDSASRFKEEFLGTWSSLEAIQLEVAKSLSKTLYMGPFRQPPQRPYPTMGAAPSEVGAMGEHAVAMLANEYIQSHSRPHLEQVSSWLNRLGVSKKIELQRVGRSDQFYVNMTLRDGSSLPIADLGYGVSQVLPVLVQCSIAPAGSTLLFEQPELHLHHGAAKKLGRVFQEAVNAKDIHIVAETHSKELFHQVFEEIRGGRLSTDQVAAYEVRRQGGKSVFVPIGIELEDGHLEVSHPWGSGLDAN
ncbi:MAG: AAA family ATPase [Burkholderiaceae bacterium]|nr:AAA family ATPase [Burkholderiaceae bacterium]